MRGVVAAGHRLTAAAADAVLREGGNACDAAIAAFFAACVAEPVLASLAGGGFLLAREPDGRAKVFDFFTETPGRRAIAGPPDFHPVTVDFGDAQQVFHVGIGACAVPGCVRGVFEAHRALGYMPMRDLVQPAVEAARAGVEVNDMQAYIFRLVEPIYMTASAAPLFGSSSDRGRAAQRGEIIHFHELADVIETLAIEGDGLFYRGEIARSIVRLCVEGGGYLTGEDLTRYRAVMRDPLGIDYRGARVLTNPPPSSGGALIGFGLRVLEAIDTGAYEHGGFDHLRMLAEVMRCTSLARAENLAAGAGADLLTGEPLIDRYRREILGRLKVSRGTTHISVIDRAGRAASMTVSNGEGCGVVIPGTGVMLNNMLGEEDINPLGLQCWTPGERMSSMMAPTLVVYPDGRLVATGSGGSNRIRTALLQVISNLVDFAMPAEDAVGCPRIHIEDRVLNVEGGIDPAVAEQLAREFPDHRIFGDRNLFFGGAHTVVSIGRERFVSAADPRRSGAGWLVE